MDRTRADGLDNAAAEDGLAMVGTPKEPPFGHILRLVRLTLNMPITAVCLSEDDGRSHRYVPDAEGTGTVQADALCNLALEQREARLVEDTLADPCLRAHPLVIDAPGIRSLVAAPLVLPDGRFAGTLFAADTAPRTLDDATARLLASLAACCVNEIELRQRASRDDLTGFMSRHAFVDRLGIIQRAFIDEERPAVLAILDLDHFKSVNDRFGHPGGDRVLQDVSALFRALLGGRADFGRIGGEEFAIAFADTDTETAIEALEELRRGIAGLRFADFPGLTVTGSFGVAGLHAGIPNVSAWLKMADAALYSAKEAGRNRILPFCNAAILSTRVEPAAAFPRQPDNDHGAPPAVPAVRASARR